MAKLEIHDTAGLIRYAISAGIIAGSVQLTIVQGCDWNRWAGFVLARGLDSFRGSERGGRRPEKFSE